MHRIRFRRVVVKRAIAEGDRSRPALLAPAEIIVEKAGRIERTRVGLGQRDDRADLYRLARLEAAHREDATATAGALAKLDISHGCTA